MTTTPTWFGPPDNRLFGWLHLPAGGQAFGCAILCPPLGREHWAAHRTYRLLAEHLAAQGIAVLRFDYTGTGDSAPAPEGVPLVDSCLESVAAAARYLRDSGAPAVSLIGMRLGATIAAAAAAACGPISSVVLWDACATGAAFLREQQALQQLAFGDSTDKPDRVDLPWLTLRRSDADRLRSLRLDQLPSDDCPVLLLQRASASTKPLASLLDRPGIQVEAVDGQAALLDVPSNKAQVPRAAVQTVVDFVVRHGCSDPFVIGARIQDTAVVGHGPDGEPILERIQSFGPDRLFGFVTGGGQHPPVLFLNVATEHHVGPGALWVTLSRQIAGLGHAGIRFDLTGLGDSPLRDLDTEQLSYLPESIADVLTVAREVAPADPRRVIIVGLCSGAWTAAMTARVLGPRAVYLINPVIWHLHPRPLGTSSPVPVQFGHHRPHPHAEGLRTRLRAALPEPVWRLLGRLGLVHSPSMLLAPAVARGTDITLLYGADEGSAILHRPIGRLRGPGATHVAYSPTVDHALLSAGARDEVQRRIGSWLSGVDAMPAHREHVPSP